MRPVVVQMGVTLDGFLNGAKGYEDWGLPPEEDDVEFLTEVIMGGIRPQSPSRSRV